MKENRVLIRNSSFKIQNEATIKLIMIFSLSGCIIVGKDIESEKNDPYVKICEKFLQMAIAINKIELYKQRKYYKDRKIVCMNGLNMRLKILKLGFHVYLTTRLGRFRRNRFKLDLEKEI